MPSPFPGMDPYIETPELWPDFHTNLALDLRAGLNSQVQPHYFARLTAYRAYDVIETPEKRGTQPDVAAWSPGRQPVGSTGGAATLTPAPVEAMLPLEIPLVLNHVEIRQVETEQLVTVIEILSPVNKRRGHEAYDDYRRKRRDMLRSGAHLIEIDLLRGGERPPLENPLPVAPYYVLLSRADHRPHVQVWPIQLAERLPVLPVPLREPDPDASIDLGAAVATIYDRGAYAAQIDYANPPPPPALTPDEDGLVQTITRERRAAPG